MCRIYSVDPVQLWYFLVFLSRCYMVSWVLSGVLLLIVSMPGICPLPYFNDLPLTPLAGDNLVDNLQCQSK